MKTTLNLPLGTLAIMVSTLAKSSQAGSTMWEQWHNALEPKGQPATSLTLSVEGETDYVILTPENTTTPEKKAAEDLAHWLQKMTGGMFPIVTDAQAKVSQKAATFEKTISIGRTEQFQQAQLTAAEEDLADEGYGIAVEGQSLFLWGGRTRGPINAVYALLEEDLGCRWYTADDIRIPHRPNLIFKPVPRTYLPRLRLRDPYYRVAFNGEWSLRNRTNAPEAKVPEEWGGRMDYDGLFVHTFHRLVPPDKYFKDYPEYFMLDSNGERITHQLCTTHPDVIQLVIASVREFLKQHPHTEIVSVSKTDGGRTCQCERCRTLDESEGSDMASLLYLVNKAAEAIEEEYPNVVISTLAYLETVKPPKTVRPRKNVVIRLCNDAVGSWTHPFTPAEQCHFGELLKAWSNVHNRIYIWDYVVNFSHYLAPMPNMEVIAENIQFFVENNAEGVMTQGAYQSPGAERDWMRAWVIAKLTWNPSLDVLELMADFIWGHYGKAAPAIAEYNQLLRQTAEKYKEQLASPEGGIRYRMDHPFFAKTFLNRATEIFEQAETLAENEVLLHRVERAWLPIMYVQLSRGPEFVGESYGVILKRFEKIARREGVTHLREGSPDFEQKLEDWRKAWQE